MNTEEKILDAANEIFLEKGYDGARTNEISVRAGVNHALLHYYFRSKDKIFEAVLRKNLHEIADVLDQSFNQDGTLSLEGILAGVENHFNMLRKNPRLPRFIVTEVFSRPERAAHLENIIKDKVRPIIERLSESLKEKFENINGNTLFYDILALNCFPFLTLPMNEKMGMNPEVFLNARLEENLTLIKNRLLNSKKRII